MNKLLTRQDCMNLMGGLPTFFDFSPKIFAVRVKGSSMKTYQERWDELENDLKRVEENPFQATRPKFTAEETETQVTRPDLTGFIFGKPHKGHDMNPEKMATLQRQLKSIYAPEQSIKIRNLSIWELLSKLSSYLRNELEPEHFSTKSYNKHVATDVVKFYQLYHDLYEAEISENRVSHPVVLFGKETNKVFETITLELKNEIDSFKSNSRAINVILDEISKFLNNLLYIYRMSA